MQKYTNIEPNASFPSFAERKIWPLKNCRPGNSPFAERPPQEIHVKKIKEGA